MSNLFSACELWFKQKSVQALSDMQEDLGSTLRVPVHPGGIPNCL